MLTIFGAAAVSFMMFMYVLERRNRRFILAFACDCLLSGARASSRDVAVRRRRGDLGGDRGASLPKRPNRVSDHGL
jgi:hypothetical protein